MKSIENNDNGGFDSVEIRFVSHSKGSGLFARKPIQAGSLLFRENAVVSAQDPGNRKTIDACEFCLTTFEMAENSLLRKY